MYCGTDVQCWRLRGTTENGVVERLPFFGLALHSGNMFLIKKGVKQEQRAEIHCSFELDCCGDGRIARSKGQGIVQTSAQALESFLPYSPR